MSTHGPTSHNRAHSVVMPFCVGVAFGIWVVCTGAVRVVGVPGIPTQYHHPSTRLLHVDPTLGFHVLKSASLKVPNMPAISAHDSPSRWYHRLQMAIWLGGRLAGLFVTVGGMPVTPSGPTTQYQ